MYPASDMEEIQSTNEIRVILDCCHHLIQDLTSHFVTMSVFSKKFRLNDYCTMASSGFW